MFYIPTNLPTSFQANLHKSYNPAQCAPIDSKMVNSAEQERNEFYNLINSLNSMQLENPAEIPINIQDWLSYLNKITGLLEFGTRLNNMSNLSLNRSVCNYPYSMSWKTGAEIQYTDEEILQAKKLKKDLPIKKLDLSLCGDNEVTVAVELILSRIAAANGASVSSAKSIRDIRNLDIDNCNNPQKQGMLKNILEKQFFALERLYKMNLQSDTIFSMLKDCRSDFQELKPEYAKALQITFELNIASAMIEKAL